MRGTCINDQGSTTLEVGKTYFLFANGSNHFYVSRFDNQCAHFGCFKSNQFEMIDEVHQNVEHQSHPKPPKIKIELLEGRIYKARLCRTTEGYKSKELTYYYIKRKGEEHVYFYKDSELKQFGGCFPIYWFSDFEEILPLPNENIQNKVAKKTDTFPLEEWQQLKLF